MSLLPSSRSHVSTQQSDELDVIGIGEEDINVVINALSSATARDILSEIYESPATPSVLADRLDMSNQRVMYHINKLNEAGLIQSGGSRYSEKGQEMTIYAPSNEPLVIFVGTNERRSTFKDLLKRLIPAAALLLMASYATQVIIEQLSTSPDGIGAGGESVPTEPVIGYGALFLIGGLFVLLLVLIFWGWNR